MHYLHSLLFGIMFSWKFIFVEIVCFLHEGTNFCKFRFLALLLEKKSYVTIINIQKIGIPVLAVDFLPHCKKVISKRLMY